MTYATARFRFPIAGGEAWKRDSEDSISAAISYLLLKSYLYISKKGPESRKRLALRAPILIPKIWFPSTTE
jgi:hypothetical protein